MPLASSSMIGSHQLGSLSTKNAPMVLDMVTNDIVYELLARIDDYLN